MESLRDGWNEVEAHTILQRLAWGLSEVSECAGLSVAFFAPKFERVAFQFAGSDAGCWSGMNFFENLPVVRQWA